MSALFVHVFVSTMNGDFNCDYYPNGNYKITIINQGEPCFIDNEKISVHNVNHIGLSNSRNEIFEMVKDNEIVVVTDNDVQFFEGFDEKLKEVFSSNSIDILTFRALDIDNNFFKKNYREEIFEHNLLTLFRVSSIEIAFSSSSIKTRFDNKFGLGSDIPLGEENIFLTDNYKQGAKIFYYPLSLVKHIDSHHTGEQFSFISTIYRLAVFRRVFGYIKGTVITIGFIAKNWKKYFREYNA